MVLQREMWTGKVQHRSTTTGRFMTDLIITLHVNLVAQLLIYLPLPLMIDLVHIKEPAIPHIYSQMPSLLPLKMIFVL